MPDAPKTIISDDGEWFTTLLPRTSPQGWRVFEPVIQSTDGRLALDLRNTDWDCHDCRATTDSGFELFLHHPLAAAREQRLLVWPPGSASLTDFSGAVSGHALRAALIDLANHFTPSPPPAASPPTPPAPPAPDRFTITSDDYDMGDTCIRRCTLVEKSPARDHQFTAGTMWNTTLAPAAPDEFTFTIAHAQHPEARFSGIVSAATLRVLVDGAADAIPLFRFRDATIQFDRSRDLPALHASLGISAAAPAPRFSISSAASEVGPNQWADAACITDRLTGETLLDLSGTMWDGVPNGPDPAALPLELRHYPDGGSFLPLLLNLPARTARLTGSPKDFPLAWLHRCLNVYHAYQHMDTLRVVLLRGPATPNHPEVRLTSGTPGIIIELWPLAGAHASKHILAPRITGPNHSTMLDLRSTCWAADIETHHDNSLVNLDLMLLDGDRAQGLYIHGCYIDLTDRRLRAYSRPGALALARLQSILSRPLSREEAEAEIANGLA
ncbi:MAG: hypothetical protein GC200_10875 [Tepidisphaera sp.]|nr:hypothetical protein [Tepidisphaera sp.]